MAKGFHHEGESSVLEVYFRDSSKPGTDEFTIRLANSLLLRLTGTSASAWSIGETVEGGTSSDTGTLEGAKDNGDGSVTLKLSGIGEAEVFSMGETISGQYSGASGDIGNAVFNISNFANNRFSLNESIEDQSTGATADIKAVYGDVVEVNNISGTFGIGNTIQGKETGATGTLDKQYAGVPGLFDDDTVSDILDESSNYTPPTLSAGTTDWATLTTDLAGNYYVETKDLTIDASGGDLGPVNLAILTVDIGGGGEEIVSSAPISGTPPSEVIPSGGSMSLQYGQTLG